MSSNQTINFLFINKQATYEVISTIKHGNKQQQISYTTEITKDDGWLHTYYLITRTPQIVSPVVDNPYVEVLALTSMLWRELKLAIGSNGKITRIVNLEEIQLYWNTILKFKLTEMYEGEPIANIVRQLDAIVMDEQAFIQKINQDNFFYHWIVLPIGEYIGNPYTQQYTKVGVNNQAYQLAATPNKGRSIKSKGQKSVEELRRIKQKWGLEESRELLHQQELNCEYNRDYEMVRLFKKETYTYLGSIYRSTTIELIKK